jgi:NikR C terminal nickel binding domain
VVVTLTIVYDHHRPNFTEKLVEAQHAAGGKVSA